MSGKSATSNYLPDKMQMIEHRKLFTGSCCDPHFLPLVLHIVFWQNLMFFPIFVFFQ